MSFKGRLRRLDDKLERVKAARGRTREWPSDPVEFCIQYLGFKPTVYQEKLLRDPAQFIVARWSRQSGKTHCVAVLLLWSCLRNRWFNALVLAPSVRQSKIIIRKITGFLPRLPKYVALKPFKTKIEFYNGSRIQAFPNSPETIRGEPGVTLLYVDEFSYIKDDKGTLRGSDLLHDDHKRQISRNEHPWIAREHVLCNVHRRCHFRRFLKTPCELLGCA